MRYGADRYVVEYRESGSEKVHRMVVDGIPYDEFAEMGARAVEPCQGVPYRYAVPHGADYALLDFARCIDASRMATFADSMVVDLRNRGIRKLIIDVRENAGGNSAVGDSLLRRLASVPFIQYEEVYCRITPTIENLVGEPIGHTVFYFKASEPDYEQPLPPGQRFEGECVLLTSHKAFSSASSFARAFSHFGVGKVVGEETGGVDIHFGDIIPYSLPNSGLMATISIKRFRLPGADAHAPSPTVPNLIVPASQALDAAIEMLK